MKNSRFLLITFALLIFASDFKSFAQDTITVQTFTYQDIYKRRGLFVFPPKDESFRKILMLYNLKCDPLTPHDKYNCGEWDYLTYNLVYQKTGQYDSTKLSTKHYSYGFETPDTLYYSNNEPKINIKRTKYQTTVQSVTNEEVYNVSSGQIQALLTGKKVRAQFSLLSKDLRDLGMKSGNLQKIQIYTTSVGNVLKNLKVKLQSTASITDNHFSNSNFTTVYFGDYEIKQSGWQDIVFIKPFYWTQFQNLNIDISFEQENNDELLLDVSPAINGIYSVQEEHFLEFNSANDYVNCGNISELNNVQKFTIEAWINVKKWTNKSAFVSKGNSIFFGTGDQLGQIYCKVSNPDNTFGYVLGAIKTGDWNHLAMVFDGTKSTNEEKLRLYINGKEVKLTYTGILPSSTANDLTPVTISSNANQTSSITGSVDEVRIWNESLLGDVLDAWKNVLLQPNHPNYNNLVAYYQLDETEGYIAPDNSKNHYDGKLIGTPRWVTTNATDIYRYIQDIGFIPRMNISKGDFVVKVDSIEENLTYTFEPISIVEFTINNHKPVIDNIKYYNKANWCYYYDENGNVIDSVYNKPDGYFVNNTIEYYSEPFEIKDVTEIGRFITPYGINLDLGPNGFTWVYDVTDYEPLLHDTVDFAAGNLQELLDVKFLFIKGTPPRRVNRIDKVWGPMKSYLYKDLSSDKYLRDTTINVLPESKQFKLITRLTGHGHNSNDGNYPHCCEWKDNTHYLYSNGKMIENWHIWQTNDCATNPVYPQGGTWPGSREGWCPGDVVKDNSFEVTDYVKDNKIDLDYDITKVPENNLGMGNGNYVAAFHLIEYGDLTHNIDAEIYDVIMPSKFDYYSRVNPICSDPQIIIRNNGRDDLKSLDFEYFVQGGLNQKYHWEGQIKSMQSQRIVLPIPTSDFWLGDGKNLFVVKISNPNNKVDEYNVNDEFKSYFNMPDLLPYDSKFELKTNLRGNDFSYVLKDVQGNIVFSKDNLLNSTTYNETFNLPQGCYTLEVTDINNYGLSYWAFPDQGNGSLRITDAIGKNLKVFNPDFGHGIKYTFFLGSYSLVQEPGLDNLIYVFPNPAKNVINISTVDMKGLVKISIFDLQGKLVYSNSINNIDEQITIPLQNINSGNYLIKLENGNKIVSKRFIVK
ncbi:MAG: LamG-like jellyroll fold domain-containing protein [Candidatus Kapaibacteriota bacterium]